MTTATITNNINSETLKETLLYILDSEKGKIASYYSRFHNLTIRNMFFLALQFAKKGLPLQQVQTKSGWRNIGRTVIDDSPENKFWMVKPTKYQAYKPKTDANGNPIKVMGKNGKLKIVKELLFNKDGSPKMVNSFETPMWWYAVGNTSGKEVEESFKKVNFDLDKLLDGLKIEKVHYASADGNCQGYCEIKTGNIAINPVAVNPIKTAIHECAHSILHCGKYVKDVDVHDDRGIHEFEAESTALCVLLALGLIDDELKSTMVGYIKNWMADYKDALDKSINNILFATNKILKILSK